LENLSLYLIYYGKGAHLNFAMGASLRRQVTEYK